MQLGQSRLTSLHRRSALFIVLALATACGAEVTTPQGFGELAEEEVGSTSAELHSTFELPIRRRLALPNLFAIPGYENLEIPVYESFGRQGPGILLVHGNSSSSRAFVRQMFGWFGWTHKLYAIDLPGHGRAGQVDAARDFPVDSAGTPQGFAEYQIGLVEAVAAAANDPSMAPGIVVGWSLGGDIALLAQGAGLLPSVEGIMIFGTAPTGAAPPTSELPFDEPNVPGLPLGILPSFGFGFVADPLSPIGFNLSGEFSDAPPSYASGLIATAPSVGDAYVGAFFNDWRRSRSIIPRFFREDGFDRTDQRARASVGAIGLGLTPPGALPDELDVLVGLEGDPLDPADDIPIAVVVGEEDAFVNTGYLEGLAAGGGIPTLWRDEVIEVSRAGHAVQYERPLRFNQLLSDFVRDVDSQ